MLNDFLEEIRSHSSLPSMKRRLLESRAVHVLANSESRMGENDHDNDVTEALLTVEKIATDVNSDVTSAFQSLYEIISLLQEDDLRKSTALKANVETTEHALMEATLSSDRVDTLAAYLDEIEEKLAEKIDENESLNKMIQQQKSKTVLSGSDKEGGPPPAARRRKFSVY